MNNIVRERELLVGQSALAAETTAVPVPIEEKRIYGFLKRAFDIIASLTGLIVGFPFFLIISLVIFFDDPGNPFFLQTRIGKNGKPFRVVKFRTMYKDAEERKKLLLSQNEYDGVHYKCENDVRILRSGQILRRYSIDEMPQLINVLLNDMSLVGPRPFVPSEQVQLSPARLAVKPGLSCYWQLADKHKLTDEEQLELDYNYIRERSLKTDARIIILTVKAVICGKNC